MRAWKILVGAVGLIVLIVLVYSLIPGANVAKQQLAQVAVWVARAAIFAVEVLVIFGLPLILGGLWRYTLEAIDARIEPRDELPGWGEALFTFLPAGLVGVIWLAVVPWVLQLAGPSSWIHHAFRIFGRRVYFEGAPLGWAVYAAVAFIAGSLLSKWDY